MVKLKQDIAQVSGDFSMKNDVQILDEDDEAFMNGNQEEEDPDEALFRWRFIRVAVNIYLVEVVSKLTT